ncbi:venom allergen 5 [Lepeophtheirus salmonis]|uniref:venom allergen 5 n=1 Tax=Lepeophtheirus salmonis TaxID=72036 RepID=UPI001AE83BDB|nr:venom allergen 5-like [Lepeophtheirus salmonis]
MRSEIWQIILFVAVCATKQAISECLTTSGLRCMTKDEDGAALYFNHFKFKSTCFKYNEQRMCMITPGNLRQCECTNNCCKESGGSGGGGTGTGDKLKCDSSMVKDFQGCTDLKKTFCKFEKKIGQIIYPNTLCKYCGEDKKHCKNKICTYDITSEEDKMRIITEHNKLRSTVALGNEKRGVGGAQPPATNMNRLSWDNDLAVSAQMWALQCRTGHDKNRITPQYNEWVGQNIASAWSSAKSSSRDYESMIQGWYDEVKDFPPKNIEKYNSEGATGVVGHYTQLAWAATTKVGCGFIMYYDETQPRYPYKKVLVCNYGVGGNVLGTRMYKIGSPGSDCQNGQKDGLCY